ncbi:MAG: PAS domain-containing protein [Rubrivivax sp.]|nr:PAS domain-containing protein [Rubrivivax sp.]
MSAEDSTEDRARRPALPSPMLTELAGQPLEGVDESTWVDVIHKMDEVYQQLVADEMALEAKNAELEQQQQFIFSLLQAMSDVLVACNEEGEIEETNAALCELVGRSDEELRGRPIDTLLADEAGVERLRSAMLTVAARHGSTVEVDLRDAHDQRMPVDFNCTPRLNSAGRRVGHVFVGRPMGELKRAYHQLRQAHDALQRTQQQLLHSEKMASLGRLVAGVAHELNNPISFVLGNVHALARYTRRLEQYVGALHAGSGADELGRLRSSLRIDHTLGDLDSLMQGTLEGAQRTADIVAGLKRFSVIDREGLAPVALNPVVERAIHWVRKGTAPAFDVSFTAQRDCWVVGSEGQLLQVFMNLVQNAYDAASAAERHPPQLWVSQRISADRVRLSFRDNGPGIPADRIGHVFEPFFTTKPVGKGTGLGLSISYGIIDRHGGQIAAGNASQGGALFTVDLPTCPAPAAAR